MDVKVKNCLLYLRRPLFLWTTLLGCGRNMVRRKKWFFGPKFSDFCPKIRFFANFGTFGLIFWLFSFPSYTLFCKGTRPTWQKVLPHPTVGPDNIAVSCEKWVTDVYQMFAYLGWSAFTNRFHPTHPSLLIQISTSRLTPAASWEPNTFFKQHFNPALQNS